MAGWLHDADTRKFDFAAKCPNPALVRAREEFAEKHQGVKKNWEVDLDFPPDAVIQAFQKPTVDSSDEPFEWGRPNVPEMQAFCFDKFGWREDYTMQVLRPVLEAIEKTSVQARIDQYPSFFHRAARIRSKRVAKVVMELTKGHAAAANMLTEVAADAVGVQGGGLELIPDEDWFDMAEGGGVDGEQGGAKVKGPGARGGGGARRAAARGTNKRRGAGRGRGKVLDTATRDDRPAGEDEGLAQEVGIGGDRAEKASLGCEATGQGARGRGTARKGRASRASGAATLHDEAEQVMKAKGGSDGGERGAVIEEDEEDEELKLALALSMGPSAGPSAERGGCSEENQGGAQKRESSDVVEDEGDDLADEYDEEFQMALALSMASGDGGASEAAAAQMQTAAKTLPPSRLQALHAGSEERAGSAGHAGAMVPVGSSGLRLPASKLAQSLRDGANSGGIAQDSAGRGHGPEASGRFVLPSSALQRQQQDADHGEADISEYERQRLKRIQVIIRDFCPIAPLWWSLAPPALPAFAHDMRMHRRLCVSLLQSNQAVLQNLGLQNANSIPSKAPKSICGKGKGRGKETRDGGASSVSKGAKKRRLDSVRECFFALLLLFHCEICPLHLALCLCFRVPSPFICDCCCVSRGFIIAERRRERGCTHTANTCCQQGQDLR